MSSSEENKGAVALKAGLWYTISNIATKAIVLITTPFFARIMTKNDYGMTATFTSWYTLLVTFCTLNLNYSIGRAKIDYKDKLEDYVGTMQMIALVASLILGLIGIIFVKPLSQMMELTPLLMYILAIYMVFGPTISLNQAKFKYQYKYKENIFITLYTTLTSVTLSLILVILIPTDKFYGRVIGIVFPIVLLSLVFWIVSVKNKHVHFNSEYAKYGLAISLPLVLNGISLNILAQSDRIVITKSAGADVTAVYTIAYQLAILISIVLDSIGQAWLPWFHDTFAQGNYDAIKKNLQPIIIFGCYVGLGCILIAPEGVWIMGGNDYEAGKWVVAPIVLGLVCKFIYANYEHIELHLKKTKYIGMGTVIAAIINIILNIIFVPKYGFVAAGYTTFFSYLVLMTIHLIITKRILKVSVYNHLFMFLAIFIEALLAMGIMLLYDKVIIRYVIVVVMTAVMFFKYKDLIMPLLKKKKTAKK